jgi:hypothetical protein
MTINTHRTQNIPGSWPEGQYTYIGYAGWVVSYPAVVTDSFPFTKSTTSDAGPWVMDSSCTGEDFPQQAVGHLASSSGSETTPTTEILPNPFNPTTTISYELRTASDVKVSVYDVAGNLVATLVDGWREAGRQEVTFDGSQHGSGLYFVKMQAEGQTSTQKLVLLK